MGNRQPILEPLQNHILSMDAIMQLDENGRPFEPEWPEADVIVGNPPFLGGNRLRGELGTDYLKNLWALYEGRVPGGADLVVYWFERAREAIQAGKSRRAGLLATQAIRQGANRTVLDRIKETGDIFLAWSDRKWILDGAAVRVSMVGFDNGTEFTRQLNGEEIQTINADLTGTTDTRRAVRLKENLGKAFQGPVKVGAFDITAKQASEFLNAGNESNLKNSDVVRRWINGEDIVQRPRHMWIIDFGEMKFEEAVNYALPLEYVRQNVKPDRDKNNRARRREKWWQHGETVPGLRKEVQKLSRYIATPRVARHRIFVWVEAHVLPDSRVYAICYDNPYYFGVLHSKLHEVWSLRMASWHGVGNDPTYNASTCFETFPFPWPPGKEDTSSPAYQAISAAAKALNEEREAWLNPPGMSEAALQQRTLTNLYNALQVFRGQASGKVVPAAGDFAPRLAELHDALDRAVCDGYGWPHEVLNNDGEILRRFLALNLERSVQSN
jgi:type II restriction/modification system DNA methylase subunit YeeA